MKVPIYRGVGRGVKAQHLWLKEGWVINLSGTTTFTIHLSKSDGEVDSLYNYVVPFRIIVNAKKRALSLIPVLSCLCFTRL